jgi:hypothetical protein
MYILHQDDARVGAVETGRKDEVEREMEGLIMYMMCC